MASSNAVAGPAVAASASSSPSSSSRTSYRRGYSQLSPSSIALSGNFCQGAASFAAIATTYPNWCSCRPAPRQRLGLCVASSSGRKTNTHQSAQLPLPPSFDASSSRHRNIWLSDVAVQWQKPYFLNREWSPTDVFMAGFMVAIHGLCLVAPFTFTWQAFGVFLLSYVVTGMLGITLSYHRNLSHKSFTLPKWLEYTFAYCGVLAMQGDPLEWVSSHRYHHQHCDTDKDPHSPYEGFWYSHMGWVLDNKSTLERVGARGNVGDMAKDPFYRMMAKTYIIHPVLAAVCLYAWGGLPFVIWGVAVRAVWVYHITWLVNSAAHVWGTQVWNTGDLSRNNWWVALLAFGEGWHNNHHAFEYSARHGLEWWQFDPTWYFILALQKLGLASKVKLPLKDHMERMALKTA